MGFRKVSLFKLVLRNIQKYATNVVRNTKKLLVRMDKQIAGEYAQRKGVKEILSWYNKKEKIKKMRARANGL